MLMLPQMQSNTPSRTFSHFLVAQFPRPCLLQLVRSPFPSESAWGVLTITGNATLPPPTGLTLKYITVGHGVQNYTCSSPSADVVPKAIGALATLYDVTSLALLNPDLASSLPALAASHPLTSSFIVPNTPLSLPDVGTFPVLGGHFFNADATPVFDLFTTGTRIFSKVAQKIKAPKQANRGLEQTGAVDWLALVAKEGSVGLSEVFRVETAGGNPPVNCAGAGAVVSVPYAAAYHFYE